MTVDALFWSFVGAVAGSVLTMLLSHVSAVASARRTSYAEIGAALVSLWRTGGLARTDEIMVQLSRLAVDGNRDLRGPVNAFVEDLRAGSSDAQQKLVRLLDKMRETAFLANVRESFLTKGDTSADLLHKIIEY